MNEDGNLKLGFNVNMIRDSNPNHSTSGRCVHAKRAKLFPRPALLKLHPAAARLAAFCILIPPPSLSLPLSE